MLAAIGFWIVYAARCSRYTGIEWWSLFRLIFCIRMYLSKWMSLFFYCIGNIFSQILVNKFLSFAGKILVNIVSILFEIKMNTFLITFEHLQFMLIWGHKHPIQQHWISPFLGLPVHELGKSKPRKFLVHHVARKSIRCILLYLACKKIIYYRPDEGCLQYNTGLTGRITSFNFIPTDETHLQNQKYIFYLNTYYTMHNHLYF